MMPSHRGTEHLGWRVPLHGHLGPEPLAFVRPGLVWMVLAHPAFAVADRAGCDPLLPKPFRPT